MDIKQAARVIILCRLGCSIGLTKVFDDVAKLADEEVEKEFTDIEAEKTSVFNSMKADIAKEETAFTTAKGV